MKPFKKDTRDTQEQECSVEDKMSAIEVDQVHVPSSPFVSEIVVIDTADIGKTERMGNKDNDENIPLEKTKRRDVGRVPEKNQHYGQEDMGADEVVLLYE